MIIAKFRHKYPQGSLVSELIEIDGGTYIVKASVQIDNLVLATALAGATTVEEAEDAAKERAIATLCLDHQPDTASVEVKPGIKAEGTSNHNIVNFSKPQSAPVIPNQATSAEMSLPISPTEVSLPQLDIVPEASVESSPVNPEVGSSLSTETNIFGDTFVVETPSIIPFPDEELTDAPATASISSEVEAMDFNEIKQKTDIEIKRLSWTKDQGKEFLMSRYGKRSRLHLTDEQLLEFLRYLETLPNPVK
jgi:hypothetical protein